MSHSRDFAKALTEKFRQEDYIGFEELIVHEGRRFDKLVVVRNVHGEIRPESVFAFVERATGDLYKAASWRAPAKHKRYNGDELLNMAVDDADLYGRFLYMH